MCCTITVGTSCSPSLAKSLCVKRDSSSCDKWSKNGIAMEHQKNSSLVSAGGLSLSVCFAACLGASTVVLNSSAIVVVSWNQALNISSPVSRMSLMHWLTLATSLKAETMSCAFFCKLAVSGLMYCKHFRATTNATRNGPLLICMRKPFAEDIPIVAAFHSHLSQTVDNHSNQLGKCF